MASAGGGQFGEPLIHGFMALARAHRHIKFAIVMDLRFRENLENAARSREMAL